MMRQKERITAAIDTYPIDNKQKTVYAIKRSYTSIIKYTGTGAAPTGARLIGKPDEPARSRRRKGSEPA